MVHNQRNQIGWLHKIQRNLMRSDNLPPILEYVEVRNQPAANSTCTNVQHEYQPFLHQEDCSIHCLLKK